VHAQVIIRVLDSERTVKLRQISTNAYEVEFKNGIKVLFSYSDVVAAYDSKLKLGMRSKALKSKTTAWHAQKWLASMNCSAITEVPQAMLDNVVGSE
jgi:hypothetical protein